MGGDLVEKIEALEKQELEEFLDTLLDLEAQERFDPGTVEMDGPTDRDLPDGLRDNWVTLRKAAHTAVHHALLPPGPADVRYSCKTVNNPKAERDGCMNTIREELDPGKVWNGVRDGKTDAHAARQKALALAKDKPGVLGLYDHLADGGRYVIVLGWRPGQVREFREELVQRLQWRLLIHKDEAFNLDEQINTLNANQLMRATERLERRLRADWRKKLGLDEAPFWLRWGQWSNKYTAERKRMDFIADVGRETRLGQLRAFMVEEQPDRRALHVWGSPGVGKTRLVHELLSTIDKVESRVRYTTDLAKAVAWLQTKPTLASDAVFVVDEVEPFNLHTALFAPFNRVSHDQPGARLIAIGPLHEDHRGEPSPLDVAPLSDDKARELLNKTMGDDDRLEHVVELCEGYPLFILWLGLALKENPKLLAAPGASLTGGSSEWDACVGVLDSPKANEGLARTRAKALLLALLVPEGRWQALPIVEQEVLARALVADCLELSQQQTELEKRGLLRRLPDHRVYVSPQNLERMLLNHFFGGPSPGLDPDALRGRAPGRFPKLLERAERVGASTSCKKNLARAHLRAAEICDGREPWGQWMEALLPASHVAPEDAVLAIQTAIGRLGSDTIVQSGYSMVRLGSSLAHLSHRALSPAAFGVVEDCLFRLISEPLGVHAENMRKLWMQLFAPSVHMTRQPFAQRWELLGQRLEASTNSSRKLAVAALGRAVDLRVHGRGWTPGVDDVDGPWELEQLPADELLERLELQWSALLATTEDLAPEVAEAARQAVLDEIRHGLRGGLDPEALELLAARVGTWSPELRVDFADRIADVHRWDEEVLDGRGPSLRRALAGLSEALAPTTWAARLRAQVGSWRPGPWSIDADDRPLQEQRADEELARDLLMEPELLDASWTWLLSKRAVRARAFASALGRSDRCQRMWASILTHLDDEVGLDFATYYVLGWGEGVGRPQLDAWLDENGRGERPTLLIRVLLRLHPSDQRVALFGELLDAQRVLPIALGGVVDRSTWPQEAPLALVDALIEFAAAQAQGEVDSEGVGLLAARVRRSTDALSQQTRAAMHTILDRVTHTPLPAVTQRRWSKAVAALARSGDLAALRAAFGRSFDRDTIDHPDHLVAALRALRRSGLGDALWPLITELLAREHNGVRLAVTLQQTQLLPTVSPPVILDWVGDDRTRAEAVATLLWLEADELDEVARGLLEQFGPRGRVAQNLATQTRGWGRLHAGGSADFWLKQAKRARGWATGESPAVQQWADELAQQLELDAVREREDVARQLRYA